MYKFDNGQISLEDFGQPVGMNLKNSNRWVKRAQMIPWLEIEKKYAKLFSNKKGNVAKSLRLGLGATPTRRSRFKSKRIRISNTSAATKPLTTASRRLIHR